MPSVSVKELIESGVHFGHRTSRWNPKMKPFIYGRRNLIHIINVKETVRGLVRARHFLYHVAAEGGMVLFVATKRQAKDVVREAALSCEMPYATERWLGGMLTNFATVRSRLKKLEELERLVATGEIEQYSKKMIASINRGMRKLRRNLDGVRHMTRLPDAVVIIDPRRENIALKETRKLNIANVCVLDTDCDPDLVDICIPANDDAMRSVGVLIGQLAGSVAEGRKEYEQRLAQEKKKAEEKAEADRERERQRKEAGAKKKADEAKVQAALKAREEALKKAAQEKATPGEAAEEETAPAEPVASKVSEPETAGTAASEKAESQGDEADPVKAEPAVDDPKTKVEEAGTA